MTPAPVYTGWAQYHHLKRIGGCLACNGTGIVTDDTVNGDESQACIHCPREPDVHPDRSVRHS